MGLLSFLVTSLCCIFHVHESCINFPTFIADWFCQTYVRPVCSLMLAYFPFPVAHSSYNYDYFTAITYATGIVSWAGFIFNI